MVGVFARNAPEWSIADFAILSVRAVSVPIYATNTASQAQYIALDAGLKLVFVGDQDSVREGHVVPGRHPALQQVVAFDPATRLSGPGASPSTTSLAHGRRLDPRRRAGGRLASATNDDVATLIYTSGTTGDPKGAVLTHANFFHQFRAIDERFDLGPRRPEPLLPAPEPRLRADLVVLRLPAGRGERLPRGPASDVVACMPEVKPTAMVSVPRLYEKICAAVLDRAAKSSAARRALFRWAMGVGKEPQYRRKERRPVGLLLALPAPARRRAGALEDPRRRRRREELLLLPAARRSRGTSRSSSSPPASSICQGYGLTETSPMLTCNAPGAFSSAPSAVRSWTATPHRRRAARSSPAAATS